VPSWPPIGGSPGGDHERDDVEVPVASAQLGAVVGRVRCQLSTLNFSEMPGPNVDGDAAFLPIGTEVHAIDGFEPS
jgi:hypothetical protein